MVSENNEMFVMTKKCVVYGVLIILIMCSFSVFSQPVIHHDLMVELKPETNEIHVIDKINVAALYVKDKNTTRQVTFIVHAGDDLTLIEKKGTLKKKSHGFAQKTFPNFIGKSMHVGSVPVDVYSVELADNQQQFTVEYTRKINAVIANGSEGIARSMNTSSGLITSQGVFLAKESLWFPVFGEELLTFNLSIRTPLQWRSVSQGDRIYTEDNAVSHMDTWQESHAQDDIYIVAAKFVEYSQAAGKVNAMAFLRSADDALAQKYLDTTAQYLEMYRSLLGPYPYSKFALVENFWETGFGMPSFTLLGPKIIRFPFILHSSYPHELLHNWWGNSVYMDYSKGNWAEGLTSYLADHLVQEQRGKGLEHRRSVLQKYTNFANSDNDFPLATFISRVDSVSEAVGYGKTLMLFHMLRQKIGDDQFTQALQTFYSDFQYKKASFTDIEAVFSEISGINLSGFFSQWVKRVGSPNLTLKDVNIESLASGKYRLQAKILQTQTGEAYDLILPIVVSLANDKKGKKFNVVMSNKSHLFEATFDEKPLRFDVDPEFDLFRRLDINETPPSLSLMFGAKQSLIVLPSKTSKEKLIAYENLAKNWRASQPSEISITYDEALDALPDDKSVWIIGRENKFNTALEKSLKLYQLTFDENNVTVLGQSLEENNKSIILVGRSMSNSNNAIALISADSAAAIPGLARKLPHYGKYSYLAFEGIAPDNMLKGQWPVVNSPLSFQFAKNPTPLAALDKPKALATLSPIFSEKKLLAHVEVLASEKMQGRGLGSETLDLAADYIAEQFKLAGLKSFMPDGSYFQDWQINVGGLGREIRARNVMAYIPGSNPKYQGQTVVVSAHYDHLGLGWPDVRKGNRGKVHFGADDNASGVAVMLELAQLLAKRGGLERSVIFIAFTGEEANRLGSRHFVKNMPNFSAAKIFAAVNLDTVGRLGKQPLMAFGTGTASEWVHIFRGIGFVTGISIKSLSKDFGSSDQTSFHEINVPAVQFFSGVNTDFHSPTDTFDKIDGAGMVKVAVALKETITYLSGRENPLSNQLKAISATSKPKQARRGGRRVSLGTVPDFAYQGEGVLISDVVPDSPAAKVKIQAKDILIGMNGEIVKDLRSFAKILRKLKPGDEVSLKVLRGKDEINVITKVTER